MNTPGFKFCPSDKVLVSYYLQKKLKGEPTQFQIPDVDVYGIEPWRLFNDFNGYDDEEEEEDIDDEATCSNNLRYVFTNIRKKHGHGERFERTVTNSSTKNQVVGTWKGQTAQKEIKVSKEIVGVKKMLSFMSKQDHDEEDNEGNNKKRKRKITTNNIDQLDGISYIMHEYSTAGSCHVLCRIRRKIDKKKMKNKRMKYSSCSKNTRKNTCWDDQHQGAEYDQPLQGRMPYDDHHQMMTTNTSVLLDHSQSSMWQQQQPDQDAEYDQPLQGRMSYDDEHQMMMMMNTPVLDHDQSSVLQQQQPDQYYAEDDQLLQGRMTYDDHHHQQMMMNTPVVLDDNQSSMRQQQQQPVQSEAGVTGGLPILIDGVDNANMNTSVLLVDDNQSSMWQQQQPDQDAAAVTGGLPILIGDDDDDVDDANMNTCLEGSTVPDTSAQYLEDYILPDDDDDANMNTFAQDLEEELVDANTTTSTSDGDEDKISGAGHEEVDGDLSSQQQQQQPPAPTSEGEGNLTLLASLDFQFDDPLESENIFFSSLEPFDEPLDIISLWS